MANKQQLVHNAIYIFHVSVNIGEENFGEWLTIYNFPLYGNIKCTMYIIHKMGMKDLPDMNPVIDDDTLHHLVMVG